MRAFLCIALALLVVVQAADDKPKASRCDRLKKKLTVARAALQKGLSTAEACKDEDFACIDAAYKKVASQRHAITKIRRAIRRACHKKRRQRRRRVDSDDDTGRSRSRRRRRHRRSRSTRRRRNTDDKSDDNNDDNNVVDLSECSPRRFKEWVAKMHSRRARQHQNALNCAGDSRCVRRTEMRIILISRAIEIRQAKCKRGVSKVCRSRLFNQWLRMMRNRRAELHKNARQCTDEDQDCIRKNMRRILVINDKVKRRREQCLFKQAEDFALSAPVIDSPFHVYPAMLWRRAIECDTMRKNFREWLKSMRARRERMHSSACLCNSRDEQCIRSRFRRILAIQDEIRSGRTDYIRLVAKCDKCEPLRLRFRRWQLMQRQRRLRLHDEICRCAVKDTECVTERVRKIKAIGQRIAEGRAKILAMNRRCKADTVTTTTAGTAAPTPAPAQKRAFSGASALSAGLVAAAAIAVAALLL